MKHFYVLFLGLISFGLNAQNQSEVEKVSSTVTKEKIEGHIYFLADDLLKGRGTGEPGLKIAASYLANSLRSYGVKPNPKTGTYYQDVQLQRKKPPTQMKLILNGKEIEKKVALQASEINYNSDAVYLGFGLEEDYKGKDVKNKLVVVKGGTPEGGDIRTSFRNRDLKSELAKKAGAAGIVELVDTDQNTWGYIDHNFNSPSLQVAEVNSSPVEKFVYMWVQDQNGQLVSGYSANKNLKLELSMNANPSEEVISHNVIGIVEGTDPNLKNEYIIYSAHYDHVGIGAPDEQGDSIYNGARDNAVGTTTVLSMAENLTKYPTKRSALFIFFTAEEEGLLGSGYYVENPVIPHEQVVYCFNSDNAGYNDTTVATIIGLERTTASQHIKSAVSTFDLSAIDDPAPEQGLFDRSDNVNFAAKGIPAPTFSLGFKAFDGDVTKYYHKPGDEAHTLDFDYLVNFFKAYVLSGRLIANDSQTPFWTAGDKYEPAGKKLYNRK